MTTRGRTPAVPASAVLDEVRHLIARAAGEPCPTLGHMARELGVTLDAVRTAVDKLQLAHELQVRRSARVSGPAGFKRRMRVIVAGEWTGWTGWTVREAYRMPQSKAPDHVGAASAAGGF